jgi:hypothetical protein
MLIIAMPGVGEMLFFLLYFYSPLDTFITNLSISSICTGPHKLLVMFGGAHRLQHKKETPKKIKCITDKQPICKYTEIKTTFPL